MKPCVTPVLDDYELELILDALDFYIHQLEHEINYYLRSDWCDLNNLRARFENLRKSDDVRFVDHWS